MHSAKQDGISIAPEHDDVTDQISGIRTWSAAQSLSLQEPEETVELVVPGNIDHIALVVHTTDRICRRLGVDERFKCEAVLGVREAFCSMAHGVLCASKADYITILFHMLSDGLLVVMIAHGHEVPIERPLYESAMSGFILRSCMDEVELSPGAPSRLCLYKRRVSQPQAHQEPNVLELCITQLHDLGAPRQMCKWMAQQQDALQAWQACPNPLWLLLLSEVLGAERRQQVAAVARCIEVPASSLENAAGERQQDGVDPAVEHAVIEALDGYQLAGELPAVLENALHTSLNELLAHGVAQPNDERRRLDELAVAVVRLGSALTHADRPGGVVYAASVLQWALAQPSRHEDHTTWCVHVMRDMLAPASMSEWQWDAADGF